MTGPIGALAGVVVETIGGAVKVMLDQSYRSGRAAGRADVEHRVARTVGTPAGGGGVWGRCRTCGGDGLVEEPARPADPLGSLDLRETAVIPRINPEPGPGDTAILPRHNAGNYGDTNDQRRRG